MGETLVSAAMRARIWTTIGASLLALAAAGCAGDDKSQLPPAALSTLVLQPADLPASFDRFDEGPLGAVETTGPLRTDPTRFGRVDGWKARYRRAGTATTPGPLVIESRADLFEGDGASRDFDAYRRELEQLVQTTGGRLLTPFELGSEAAGMTFREDRVRFFRIAWRHANATALLFVNGFDGKLERSQVLELARKQQRRLEAG